jgi:hypothetical protein
MNGLFESAKKRRERSGRVVGRSVQDLAAAILVIGYRNWQFASFNKQSNSRIERERETRGFA